MVAIYEFHKNLIYNPYFNKLIAMNQNIPIDNRYNIILPDFLLLCNFCSQYW